MAEEQPDWYRVIERVSDGDRRAFLQLSQRVTRFLARARAYDFRDEWPDLTQEVVVAVVMAQREGRIRDRQAALGYIGQVTRFKFASRLRRLGRHHERDQVELEEGALSEIEASDGQPEPLAEADRLDLRRALERIPEPHRSLVLAVYGERKSYEQAAKELGVPLGSAKRYLAKGLRELRSLLQEPAE